MEELKDDLKKIKDSFIEEFNKFDWLKQSTFIFSIKTENHHYCATKTFNLSGMLPKELKEYLSLQHVDEIMHKTFLVDINTSVYIENAEKFRVNSKTQEDYFDFIKKYVTPGNLSASPRTKEVIDIIDKISAITKEKENSVTTAEDNEDADLKTVKLVDDKSLTPLEQKIKELQLIAIGNSCNNIRFMSNPDKELQLEAIRMSPYVITEIKNPCKEAQIAAVKFKAELIHKIQNPDKEVVELANSIFLKSV